MNLSNNPIEDLQELKDGSLVNNMLAVKSICALTLDLPENIRIAILNRVIGMVDMAKYITNKKTE